MKLRSVIILCLVGLCNAIENPTLFPAVGQVDIYDYGTLVVIGVSEPEKYGTEFLVNCKLQIQRAKPDLVVMKLTEIKHAADQGVEEPDDVYEWIAASADLNILTLPVLLKVGENGAITDVNLSPDDKEWSINIKVSIASLFQMNVTGLNEKTLSNEYREPSIFGMRDTTVQVVYENNSLHVHKNIYRHGSNQYMTPDTGRMYTFKRDNDQYRLEKITARSAVIAHPKGVGNEFAYNYVLQNITLTETKPCETDALAVDKFVSFRTFDYIEPAQRCDETSLTKALDYTGGRSMAKSNRKEKINQMLELVIKYFDKNHITLMKPEMKDVNLINRALSELEVTDMTTLEQIFAMLLEKKENKASELDIRKFYIFLELLPFVGTSPSVLLIRNIIRKKKVDKKITTMMLRNFVTEVRCPTEKLLAELEEIPKYCEDDPLTYQAAILSIATLVRQVYGKQPGSTTMVEKYIKQLEEKYKKTSSKEEKLLYLSGLANIGIAGAPIRMMEMFEVETDEVLRAELLLAAGPMLIKENEIMQSLIWSNLANRTAPVEVRLAAYLVYIQQPSPSVSQFLKLHWLMMREKNEKFYNFHYNTMQSLSESEAFDSMSTVNMADIGKLMIRLARKPLIDNAFDGYHILDNVDTKNGVGLRMEIMFISDNFEGTSTFGIRVMGNLNGEIVNFLSARARVNIGFYNLITEKENRRSSVISNTKMDYKILIELVISVLGGAFSVDDMNALETVLLPVSFEKYIPTDLGTPMQMYERFTIMLSVKAMFSEGKLGNSTINMGGHFRMAATRALGMKMYNPFMDIWQGVHNLDTINMNWPFDVSRYRISYEDGVKLALNKPSNQHNIMGAQSYTETQVFMENINDELRKTIPEDFVNDVDYILSVERTYVENVNLTIWEDSIFQLSKNLQVQLFDCDRDLSTLSTMSNLKNTAMTPETFASIFLFHWQPYSKFAPGVGNCGAGFKMSIFEEADRIELEMKRKLPADTGDRKEGEDRIIFAIYGGDKKMFELITDVNVNISGRRDLSVIGRTSAFYGKVGQKLTVDFNIRSQIGKEVYELQAVVDGSLIPSEKTTRKGFELRIVGMRSNEQETTHHIMQRQCKTEIEAGLQMPMSRQCMEAASSFRRYLLGWKQKFTDSKDDIIDNQEIVFPLLRANEIEFIRHKGTDNEVVHNDVLDWYQQIITPPVNHVFGLFDIFDDNSDANTCIYNRKMFLNFAYEWVEPLVAPEWTSIFKSTKEDHIFDISVKTMGNESFYRAAMRVTCEKDVIECVPGKGEKMLCTVNGKKPQYDKHQFIEENTFKLYWSDNPRLVYIINERMFIGYDGHSVRIEYPNVLGAAMVYEGVYSGKCIE